ncbi:hypothetical protein AS888_16660 [Peribacillus simplex]|uniref:Uncharacterized protein n=1 Tax=Peribacillus simplex TaxID=1478 RepID=A0A109N0H8_9BACI|nr:hypothetical protein [Peribacillus simplex]KWW21231.1 hypothetical protein AS888_16660 [Peribacillus simplex]
MKRKATFIFGFGGVLALSFFMKDMQSTSVLEQDEQPKVEDWQTSTNGRNLNIVVTSEEQNKVDNMVKLMSAEEVGVLNQEGGTAVFFKKAK